MILLSMIGALALAQAAAPEPTAADEIVVRAVRHKCELRIANRVLSDRDFNAHAREWAAGRPLRVVVPADTGYKCLAKIAFRLNDKGVTRIDFVDPPAP